MEPIKVTIDDPFTGEPLEIELGVSYTVVFQGDNKILVVNATGSKILSEKS